MTAFSFFYYSNRKFKQDLGFIYDQLNVSKNSKCSLKTYSVNGSSKVDQR